MNLKANKWWNGLDMSTRMSLANSYFSRQAHRLTSVEIEHIYLESQLIEEK